MIKVPRKPTIKLPLVVVLDIDGTCIGDVTPISKHYDIHTLASHLSDLEKINCKIPALDFKYFFDNYPITRPGFKEFIASLPKNAEIFFYTAGPAHWANIIAPQIAKYIGIRYNRPIFSREESVVGMYHPFKKSIKLIMPDVVKTLRSRYKGLTLENLKDRIFIVDDVQSNTIDENPRQILCPDYDYKECLIDITYGIPKEALNHPDVNKNVKKFYLYLYYNNEDATEITAIRDSNEKLVSHVMTFPTCANLTDDFWPKFGKELKTALKTGRGTISDNQIDLLNKRLKK